MSYPQRPTDPRYYSPSLSISIDIDESPRAPSIGVVDLPPEEEPHSPLVDPRSPSRKSKAPRMELRFIKNIQTGSTCSTVYVRDIPSGKAICLKVVRLEHGNEEMGQKLKSSRDRELEAYKAIAKSDPECRFIMNCHGVFEDDTFMYFAMDYIKSDLLEFIFMVKEGAKRKTWVDQRKKWVAQIAVGINALHKMGIIHRDIKPENILVDGNGDIRIFDFGTAYIHHEAVTRETLVVADRVYTAQYSAPECLLDPASELKKYGPMADYWALGCTVFDMFACRALFNSREKVLEYMKASDQDKERYFLRRRSTIPKEADEILHRLLDVEYQTRWGFDELRKHSFFVNDANVNIIDQMMGPADTPPNQEPESYEPKIVWTNSNGIFAPPKSSLTLPEDILTSTRCC